MEDQVRPEDHATPEDQTKPEFKSQKDFWDKLQIVFHPLNGLLTALAVALLGYYTSNILRQNETRQIAVPLA